MYCTRSYLLMLYFLILLKWKKPNYGLLKFNSLKTNVGVYRFCFYKVRLLRSDALEQYLLQQQSDTEVNILPEDKLDDLYEEIIHRFGVEWNILLQRHYEQKRRMNTFKMTRRALFLASCYVLGLRRELHIKYSFWDICLHFYGSCKTRHSYKTVVEWLQSQMSNLKVPLKRINDVLNVICGLLMLTCHLTFMILALLDYPHWQGRLKDNKTDSMIFIHEVQRYYPTVTYIPLISKKTICDYYASNHDPSRFRFPDNFYPDQLSDSEYNISRPLRFPHGKVIDDIMFVALEYLLEYSFRHVELPNKVKSCKFRLNGNIALPYSDIPISLS